jgi:hypothetical protein
VSQELREEKLKEQAPLQAHDYRTGDVRGLPHKLRALFEDNQVRRPSQRPQLAQPAMWMWPADRPKTFREREADRRERAAPGGACYDHADWRYKVEPAKGFVRVEWEQLRRVVFWLDDYDPDHQDVEADYDLYAAGAARSLLSCNDSGQRRPFILSLGREAGMPRSTGWVSAISGTWSAPLRLVAAAALFRDAASSQGSRSRSSSRTAAVHSIWRNYVGQSANVARLSS